MSAVSEGVPGTFSVTTAGITGKETAIEGMRAETAIAELVLQFCVGKADGSLQPETVRLSLDSGAALDALIGAYENLAERDTSRAEWAARDTVTAATYPQPNRLIAEKVAEMHGLCEVVRLAGAEVAR